MSKAANIGIKVWYVHEECQIGSDYLNRYCS